MTGENATTTMTAAAATAAATGGLQLADELRAAARGLFLSNDTVDWTLESCSADQVGACLGMLRHELDRRAGNKAARMLKRACFPVPKSLDAFDWSCVRFPADWSLDEMLTLGFVDEAQDIVLFGGSGLGKTHVATGLGMMAASRGIPVRFHDVSSLIMRLDRARRENALDVALADATDARLVILDEFGYVPYSVDGARLLYQVMSACYERVSIVLTTNIEFGLWGTVLADDLLAKACADRMCHHGRLLQFSGESYRLRNSLMMAGRT